jgi:hypothetical protein
MTENRLSFNPSYRAGQPPGKGFSEPYGIKLAIVTYVDEINMKATLKIVTGGVERPEIDLTQGMAGPRSFWGGVPEKNSMVILGYRNIGGKLYDACILGYIPVGNRSGLRFDPWAAQDITKVSAEEREDYDQLFEGARRYKRLILRPGDVGGMSSAGAEMTLSKDASFYNRGGDGIEFRDSDRTMAVECRHKVEAVNGVRRIAGPARRTSFFLPDDIFLTDEEVYEKYGELRITQTLKTTDEGYYGRDELESAGPGEPGEGGKWVNEDGSLNPLFNDHEAFPPIRYSNGRKAFYVGTRPAVITEDPDAGAMTFIEDRFEMDHATTMSQDVLDDIDGFQVDRKKPYIERIVGSVIGNDLTSTAGQRTYSEVLKPTLFSDFAANGRGRFALEGIDRSLLKGPDEEVWTSAAAYLFRIRPPRSSGDNDFACAVTKQGKLYLNLPASTVESYASSGSNNVSAELNLAGALKAFVGASSPDRISAHLTLAGGLHLDVGPDADGNAITIVRRGGIKYRVDAVPNENDMAEEIEIRGCRSTAISGADVCNVNGQKSTQVSGMYQIQGDRGSENYLSGKAVNAGSLDQMISGKSQLQYALAVLETIAAGGKVSTVLAGGRVDTTAIGAHAINVGAGPYSVAAGAGAVAVTSGLAMTNTAGAALSQTAGAAMSMTAGAAAAITAGAAVTITAAAATTITSPIVALGVAPVLGVIRAIPALPAGTPSLCFITALPFLGGAQTTAT